MSTFDEAQAKNIKQMLIAVGAQPCLYRRAGQADVQTVTIINSEFATAPDGKTLGKLGAKNLIASLSVNDVETPVNGDSIIIVDKDYNVTDTSVTYHVYSVKSNDGFQVDVVVTK